MKKPVSSLFIQKQIQAYEKKVSDVNVYPNETEVKQKIDQESYFYSSSSDNDDYIHVTQEIVEKTIDNAFGRFEELLGSGVFKRVYKGYDFNAGREIAWSVINVASSSNQNFNKITEEINIMKQLNHPNIIHFISGWYDEDKKQVIIITEMVSGGSLKENLKRIKEPRLRLVKKWIKQILSGLDYLHKKNIIHRDIKCDNIFLDNFFGNVKIGDLGGSELLYTKYGKHYVGTEEFMAPEVVEGRYTVKADIYSLGMSIIEMLTLEKPYKECDVPMAIYYNITHGIYPESLSKINDENMVNFIKLCLKREHDRPSASELLFHNAYLNDELSEENNFSIKIINQLRQNNFSNKLHQEIIPIAINKSQVLPISSNRQEFASIVSSYKSNTNMNMNSIQKKTTYDLAKGGISDMISNNKTTHSIFTESSKVSLNNSTKIKSPPLNIEDETDKNAKLYKKCSSFAISIKDPNRSSLDREKEKDKDNITHQQQQLKGNEVRTSLTNPNNHSEVEITFIVKKEEWKNKKLLKCPYNFETDTVDGLASELQKAINLNDDDYHFVKHKLNESSKHIQLNHVLVSKYTSASSCSSQRNTISSVSGSGDVKQKNKYDEFVSAFNHFHERIKSLLHNDSFKRLEEMINGIKNKHELSNDIQHRIDIFKKNEKCLFNIMSHSNCK